MDGILPMLLGGLILFIYSIKELSDVMRGFFSESAKMIISKYTNNVLSAILIGTIMTILLGSSSAVIIIVIVFINAHSLSFRQAMGIIMGANIGTTFSSQIIALDVGRYAIIPLAIGLILEVVSKKERIQSYGQVMFYFGMLFFGLFIIEESVLPLRDSPIFEEWVSRVDESSFQGTLIGGLITLIIQSSSATVGMAIVLGKQNLITIAGGIAVMMGAELGTCSDTLLATIRGTRQAFKAGLFHLIFNLCSISLGLLFFYPFVDLIDFISGDQGIDNQIANAHMVFNILGVVLFFPFIRLFENVLNYLIPEREVES